MTYAIAAALQKAVFERLQADAGVTGLVADAIYDAIPPGIVGGTYVSLGPEDVRDASDDTGYGAWVRAFAGPLGLHGDLVPLRGTFTSVVRAPAMRGTQASD